MHVMFRIPALIMMTILMLPVTAVSGDGGPVVQRPDRGPAAMPPAYPDWPEREVRLNAVPSPPLGPYLSTGLSSTGTRFACCDKVVGPQEQTVPFKDMPWPERRLPPRQWMPEGGGYNYAPENADNTPAPRQQGGYWNQRIPQPTWQPLYQRPPQGRYR
jgi:hypothetical protein